MKQANLIVAVFLLLISTACIHDYGQNYVPKMPPNGYVPDSETAIKIAVAIWTPIYGKEHIEKQQPYSAELNDGIWHVTGSLPRPRYYKDEKGHEIGVFTIGGVPEADISQKTGEILRIIHSE